MITSFRHLIDSKDKIGSSEDYFNFTVDYLNTSNTQVAKILSVQLPYTWSNFRTGVNDVLELNLVISGSSYTISFQLSDTFKKSFRNLTELLQELNSLFLAGIQSKLTAAGYGGGTPHLLSFENPLTQGEGKLPLILTFAVATTWGSGVINTSGTTNPRIASLTNNTLSEMLGLTNQVSGVNLKNDLVVNAYQNNVDYNQLAHVIPTYVRVKSNYFTAYQNAGSHLVGNKIIQIPLADYQYLDLINYQDRCYFNHHPVGGHGGNIDISVEDDFGTIRSYNPRSRFQMLVEFYQDVFEDRD